MKQWKYRESNSEVGNFGPCSVEQTQICKPEPHVPAAVCSAWDKGENFMGGRELDALSSTSSGNRKSWRGKEMSSLGHERCQTAWDSTYWVKNIGHLPALLAGQVQTTPRQNFKQVYLGLLVWSSHWELHPGCEGAERYHPQLPFQFILEEFLWKDAQDETAPIGLAECWWRLPSHIQNSLSVLFCQTVMTVEHSVYSSGL